MKPHLLITRQTDGTFVVRLVSDDGVLGEAGALTDAQRVARSISAWTHLPIYEATHG